MHWQKLGRLFEPAGQAAWIASHAALPWAVPLHGDTFRVYCAGRDVQGRSQVGIVELDLFNPVGARVLQEPVLALGTLGAFDDNGVMNACLLHEGERDYLYYVGMTTGGTVPFRSFTGLATSEDGLKFVRTSPSPILERDAVDPYLTAASFVLRDGERWHMWYTSGVRWAMEDRRPKHYYHIKYASSSNGIDWERSGSVCIDFQPGEYAIARPFVVKENGVFKMWYSYRGDAYRIGYAESDDGIAWDRKDREAGIDVSPSGWDSEMVCYASVFDHGGERYMLYNGNGYGKTGFGLARLAH